MRSRPGPLAGSIPIAGRTRVAAARHRRRARSRSTPSGEVATKTAFRRSSGRLAVVPRRPRRAPSRRRRRTGSGNARKPADRARAVDVRDPHGRAPGRAAVRRARGGDREPPGLPEVGHDQVAVGPDRREHADRRPGADVDAGRPRQPAVVRPAHREHVTRRPSGCRRGSSVRRTATSACCRTRSSSCRTRFPPRRQRRSPRRR